jgi:dTDP-4-dehydrorhamnose reductase
MLTQKPIEIWGGIEGTINRVQNDYIDQSEFSGHYNREDDIDLIASLGIKMLRYPVLWEKHQPEKNTEIDWTFVERNLLRLKALQVEPIAGLVHHGSGPTFVNFFDGSFEQGVADYAKMVAEKFPWLEYYTPVNEPLTTARFCGLYGHWYPHEKNARSFYRILLSECKATVMAMAAIREVNPNAKLIQTEDLGKVYSTPLLKYQADFENERRWLSYDLITGTLTSDKTMYKFLTGMGFKNEELDYFLVNNCAPHIVGFNYYITSERYLDENLQKYPADVHGGNGKHQYADVEVVRVPYQQETGLSVLLKEAWERYKLPLAITECHLHCTREEQMRWFYEVWETANELQKQGVDVRALTAWAILGTYGWNKLVTKPWGLYEPGVFNLRSGKPRPTAMVKLIQELARNQQYHQAVLETSGWWKQDKRITYPDHQIVQINPQKANFTNQPVLVFGKNNGILETGFSKICEERNIHCRIIDQNQWNLNDINESERLIKKFKPWAIIKTPEFEDFEKTETILEESVKQIALLAEVGKKHQVKLVAFSSPVVFDGQKESPYVETDGLSPVNTAGKYLAQMEKQLTESFPETLIIRVGRVFSPWENGGFVSKFLTRLREGRTVKTANDRLFSLTYVPDLVQESLNLLLDDESGIAHLANNREVTYAEFARKVAQLSGLDASLVKGLPAAQLSQKAEIPLNLALESEKGFALPDLDSALKHYLVVTDQVFVADKIAV